MLSPDRLSVRLSVAQCCHQSQRHFRQVTTERLYSICICCNFLLLNYMQTLNSRKLEHVLSLWSGPNTIQSIFVVSVEQLQRGDVILP